MQIEVLGHSSIKLIADKIIYIDPYDIKEETHDADYIFITHDHYDHYDKESISKIRKETTKTIVPKVLNTEENSLIVEPNKNYKIDDLSFETIPSYNIDKPFHPKEKEYVGYNILLHDEYFYIMGDTDQTPEVDMVKTDVCFVPIAGVYTMDVNEAANYINNLNPKKAIPIHYGKIVGDISLGEEFKNKVNKNIQVDLLIKER
ncbi:MAG: MBL fold metallo-hydrolase [Bacilli bacterium]|nr:MBL fold metallo-hydrolase [Bacilli bacterium]